MHMENLVAAYRWEIDGDHSQLEASRWNTEEFWTWLADGRVRGYYLFIERAGLTNSSALMRRRTSDGRAAGHPSETILRSLRSRGSAPTLSTSCIATPVPSLEGG